MPIVLPSNWKPGKGADVPQEHAGSVKKPRKEPSPYVEGWKPEKPVLTGRAYTFGPVHRWQRRDEHRWLSFCGRERSAPGWAPDGRLKGKKCPRCFGGGEG